MRVVFAEKVFKGQRSKVKVIARPNALCGGGFYTSRRGLASTRRLLILCYKHAWICSRL